VRAKEEEEAYILEISMILEAKDVGGEGGAAGRPREDARGAQATTHAPQHAAPSREGAVGWGRPSGRAAVSGQSGS